MVVNPSADGDLVEEVRLVKLGRRRHQIDGGVMRQVEIEDRDVRLGF